MKLTTKLILAFLLVSLFSTGIIVALTRAATNREFNRFVNDQYRADLVDRLANYYQEYQSWDGIEESLAPFGGDHYKPGDDRPLFFSIADMNGKIIISGVEHRLGEIQGKRTKNKVDHMVSSQEKEEEQKWKAKLYQPA